MKLKMFSHEAKAKVEAFAQALPAGQERAKLYEISSVVQVSGKNGVAFAVANQHRSEFHIREAIYRCVEVGIAEEVAPSKVEFFDGSTWEPDGCTPA